MEPDKDLESFLNSHKGEMVIITPIKPNAISFLLEPIDCVTTNSGTYVRYRNAIGIRQMDIPTEESPRMESDAKIEIEANRYSPKGKILYSTWCTYNSLPKECSDAIKDLFPR